ncbi:MAG: ATP-binding protein [Olsenella sp.]|jgi:serine/threonine-protein kinase RsbW|nr:ATP-binding protein [Olsenella sp.]
MSESNVSLSIPAEAGYARAVRMMAANLAVMCDMSVDDVEDVRMAAEEGFVYSCATAPKACDVSFSMGDGFFSMDFSLGERDIEDAESTEDLGLVELLLQAVCDECEVAGGALHLVKRNGGAHA